MRVITETTISVSSQSHTFGLSVQTLADPFVCNRSLKIAKDQKTILEEQMNLSSEDISDMPVPYCLDNCGFVVEPEIR